jgi:hypothetical protein
MLIELTCACGKRLQVSDEFAGRQGQCPACGELLDIPTRDGAMTRVAVPSDEAAQGVSVAPGLDVPKRPGAPEDATIPPAGSAADLHDLERGSADADQGKLTCAGCLLTLLSVAVIFGVAIPIVGWCDSATGQPLPVTIAIVAPILIGAAVCGIGSLFLRLIGLRVWAKRESDAERKR